MCTELHLAQAWLVLNSNILDSSLNSAHLHEDLHTMKVGAKQCEDNFESLGGIENLEYG